MSRIAERIILDLETKKSFDEVEERKLELLGVSVVGIYSYKENQFKIFSEKDITLLLPYLQQAELIIGFNIKGFDFPVLQPYFDFDLLQLSMLDIFEEVQKSLGFRLSLNNIAQATLEIGKIGTGLDALKYFRLGQVEKLAEYCQHDVFITRELYEYGKRYGHLLYFRGRRLETIPVNWAECRTIEEILKEAFANRQTLEIEYASGLDRPNNRQKRQIDIYNFELGRVVAYCHLRQELRTFNIRRILKAKFIDKKYKIPADF
jgi:DEAD/DEAH box helicase domain-containing protein